jgi:hypothetical protein
VTATIALVIFVPGCIAATIWQIGVARSGNDIGWAYAVMWPLFAAYGCVLWWHIVHDDPDAVGLRGVLRLRSGPGSVAEAAERDLVRDEAIRRAEEEDPELAAYNAYLAELARQDAARGRRP